MMNYVRVLLLLAGLLVGLVLGHILFPPPSTPPVASTPSTAAAPKLETRNSKLETRLCTRVIDGDTIVVDGGEHIRLIDRDCFEIRRGARLNAQAKPAGITPEAALVIGKRQADELRRAIEGKKIKLLIGNPERDRYGRTRALLIEESP